MTHVTDMSEKGLETLIVNYSGYVQGDPLRTIEKALGMAKSMTYNGIHPVVRFIDNSYKKGVKLKAQQRRLCEKALCRLQGLRKWFISIDRFDARQICPLLE